MTTTVATSSLLSVDRSLARLTANFFAPSLKLDDQSLRKCSDSEGRRQMPRASDATKLRICSTFNESSRFIAYPSKFRVEEVVQESQVEFIVLTWYCDRMIRWGIRAFYLYSGWRCEWVQRRQGLDKLWLPLWRKAGTCGGGWFKRASKSVLFLLLFADGSIYC